VSSFKEAVKETVEIAAAGVPYLVLCVFAAVFAAIFVGMLGYVAPLSLLGCR
jgi:hypothetical protein